MYKLVSRDEKFRIPADSSYLSTDESTPVIEWFKDELREHNQS